MEMTRPKWYLSDIKKKTNRDWTLNERILILTLREKGVSSEEIAKKVGTSKIRIYNVVRITRKQVDHKCYACGSLLSEKELKANAHRKVKNCFSCKKQMSESKKDRREKALERGLCGYCQKRKVTPGKKSCHKCVSATHRRRYILGICGICGENPINKKRSITMCSTCLDAMRSKATKYRINYAKS